MIPQNDAVVRWIRFSGQPSREATRRIGDPDEAEQKNQACAMRAQGGKTDDYSRKAFFGLGGLIGWAGLHASRH